jgi:hypothetical protein
MKACRRHIKRRSPLVGIVPSSAFGVACMAALVLATGAAAAPKSINGFVGGAGGINTGGLFTEPRDAAVYVGAPGDPDDDKLLVVERHRVQRLDASGNFELLWGRDTVLPGAPGNTGNGFEVCSQAVSGAARCKAALTGDDAGELDNPTGIAVDQTTGHVFVMDRGNRRVQEFTLAGGFVRAWGWGVDSGANAFEVCTSGCQAGSTAGGGEQAGQFADATINSIAVSPTAPNDVFVTDAGNERVVQVGSDGAFRHVWGFDVSPAGGAGFEACATNCRAGQALGGPNDGQFAGGWPRQVAVDAGGVVYASDSTDDHRIVRFDSDPGPATPPDAAANLLQPLPASLLGAGATTGPEVDPNTGNLLVTRDDTNFETAVVDAFIREIADPGADLPPGGPPNPSVVDTHVLAEAADDVAGDPMMNLGFSPTTGNIYQATINLKSPPFPGGKFTGCPPDSTCAGLLVLAETTGTLAAAIDSPSNTEATSAELAGSVTPGGGIARYRFQVSVDGATWTDVGGERYIGGAGTVSVNATATGLEPNTLYQVRLTASKQTGIPTNETVVSSEAVFLTDAKEPAVRTLGSARRTDVSVRLRGLVDPEGSSTTYRFEYGLDGGSFDVHVPVPDALAGAGNQPDLVQLDVGGLQPDTAYHYRVVATNAVGTSTGDPVSFRTRSQAPPPPPPAGRGYELVSPPDKVAGVGVGIWYQGPSSAGLVGHPAHVGERFAVQGTFGATLANGQFSFASDWTLAERTPQGWVNRPVASRRAHGSQTLVFMTPTAAAPDLSLTSWGYTTLKLFQEQEDWLKQEVGATLFVRDFADGRWEIVGPTDPAQGGGLNEETAVAGDGRSIVAAGGTRGLAGAGDPSLDLAPGTRSVYLDEVPDGPSNTFPGAGVRRLVNACTAGTEIPARVDVGGAFKYAAQPCPAAAPGRDSSVVSTGGAVLGPDRDRVISEDGSRVFFMSPRPGGFVIPDPGEAGPQCIGTGAATTCPPQLFVRQRNANGEVLTRWLSRTQVTPSNGAGADQDASLVGAAFFEGASPDGDKVFFRSDAPLTADDPNGEGVPPPPGGVTSGELSARSWDLFMYDMPDGPNADPADGELTRISAGPDGDGDCNSPAEGWRGDGALRFASDDGTRLYFTCAAPLDGVPLAENGTITEPGGTPETTGASNLYLYDAAKPADERWRFVARLTRTSTLGSCAARGAQQGQPLAGANEHSTTLNVFDSMSCVRGTADGGLVTLFTDARLTDDDPDTASGDVYAYDADRDELTRVSAPEDGSGGAYPCLLGATPTPCFGDGGFGPPAGGMGLPRLGVAVDPATGDRMVFFESRSRLIASDTDTAYDVYQWRAGELTLLTPGHSTTDGAMFAGNDSTGRNVYFATRDRLTWQDTDAVLDVYTARTDGGIPQPPPTPGCDVLAGECQPPGSAPGGSQSDSDSPTPGDNTRARRVALAVTAPGSKGRRRAARTGVLAVRLAVSAPVRVRLTARARIGGKTRRVGSTARTADQAGSLTVRVRLSKSARRSLRARKRLRIQLTVRAVGARTQTVTIALSRR